MRPRSLISLSQGAKKCHVQRGGAGTEGNHVISSTKKRIADSMDPLHHNNDITSLSSWDNLLTKRECREIGGIAREGVL